MHKTLLFFVLLITVQIFHFGYNFLKFSLPFVVSISYSWFGTNNANEVSYYYVPKLIEESNLQYKLRDEKTMKLKPFIYRISKTEEIYQESAELIIKKWLNNLNNENNNNNNNNNKKKKKW